MGLGGGFQDYSNEEDKILKRAYMAGFPNAKFHLRGHNYIYDFRRMVQINKDSRKERRIRAPHKWKAPSTPIVPAGPTTVVNVPPGASGTVIQVSYPGQPGKCIAVNVPRTAKPEHGLDATVDAAGDGIADAAAAVGDFAVDAGEFVVDAGESVGDFIMDLF